MLKGHLNRWARIVVANDPEEVRERRVGILVALWQDEFERGSLKYTVPWQSPQVAEVDAASIVRDHYLRSLATHLDSTYEEAGAALDSYSPCLRTLLHSRPGWALLTQLLAGPTSPQMVATLH